MKKHIIKHITTKRDSIYELQKCLVSDPLYVMYQLSTFQKDFLVFTVLAKFRETNERFVSLGTIKYFDACNKMVIELRFTKGYKPHVKKILELAECVCI